ncbi:MAG: SH3 domain-containing protein [Aristaeellaceae bacterium]|nr:SH3 domain-containing protein [Eubacteriales bacterium]
MKRNWMRSVLCLLLVLTLAIAPMCAFASTKTAKILKINVDQARMRTGASGEIITTLAQGTKVLYLNRTDGAYCKVCTTNGTTGYVYKGFLSSYGSVRADQVYVTTGSTTLYKLSGNSLRKSSTLKSGTYMLVYKTNGNWAYVKSMSGKSGYVKLSSIRKVF